MAVFGVVFGGEREGVGELVAVRHDLVAVRQKLVAVNPDLLAVRHDLVAYCVIFIKKSRLTDDQVAPQDLKVSSFRAQKLGRFTLSTQHKKRVVCSRVPTSAAFKRALQLFL
ncbi:hypothetical protein [Fictibacillus enclensis]|uniref:hypothetical protein n=1 Tax=Fictibacillus enclensis TaxID=1017270 RepID=UPI0024BFA298|nr:hypothetical protein [Fictibacillus enclensis]WHY73126.1 hypothetical protein QNH15_04100 [Fictibacillus enclensis]